MDIKSFFKVDRKYTTTTISLILTIVVGLLAYNRYFIYEYTNPDGIIEGLTHFNNATWVLTGCGRWFLAIITYLSGNVVMPFASVIGYCLCVWLSSFIICKMWDIKSSLIYIIVPIIMIVTPATIIHFSYNAIAFPYSLALLLATLFVYLNVKFDNIVYTLPSIICLTLSLGIFQSYIGYAACLSLMTLIILLINKEKLSSILKIAIKLIVSAIVACALYYLALFIILKITNLELVSRMAETSTFSIFTNLLNSIINAYEAYFSNLNDSMLFRKYFYLIIIALIVYILVVLLKDNIYAVVIFVLTLLIPLASNIVGIVIPGSDITTSMNYQNVLLLVFAIILYDYSKVNKYVTIAKYMTIACALILCWTYIISANATFASYKLSYNYINGQMQQVVYDVQHNENYKKNETPVVIVGFFDESALRKNIKTYKYALDFPESAAFWKTPVGTTFNRQKYFINYFGLDFKDITNEEYNSIINSSEFKQMNNWPIEGSIQMINNYLVVKISNDYVK